MKKTIVKILKWAIVILVTAMLAGMCYHVSDTENTNHFDEIDNP